MVDLRERLAWLEASREADRAQMQADVPLAGQVITHSPDKQEVYKAVKAYLAQHPTARIFIFFAGDPIPEGMGVALALR